MSSYQHQYADEKLPSPPPYTEIGQPPQSSNQHNSSHSAYQPALAAPVPSILPAPAPMSVPMSMPMPPTFHSSTDKAEIAYSSSTGITVPLYNPQRIHIVYVHGFQGDHTTFQTFPSDLHNYLLPTLPGLQTWVYPTYKSAKPLSFAVKNLLIWLKSLEDGPIILAGHSMGGLLVAEAALSPEPISKRIIGLLAFDTPYLGMHPHVVVSGIASLLPGGGDKEKDKDKSDKKGKDGKEDKKDKGKQKEDAEQSNIPAKLRRNPTVRIGMKTERDVNGEGVRFVDQKDAFPMTPGGSVAGENEKIGPNAIHTPVSAPNSPPGGPAQQSTSETTASNALHVVVSNTSHASNTSNTSHITHTSKHSEKSSIMAAAQSYVQKHANDPFMNFFTKHSEVPIGAMVTWVVEYFEFGFAMFDYGELVERYKKLEVWEGDWVNFWSITTTGAETNVDTTFSITAAGPEAIRNTPRISITGGVGADDIDDEIFSKDEDRPPTPNKITRSRRPPTASARYEDEFEKAMKKAMKKNAKRHEKDGERSDNVQDIKAGHQTTESTESTGTGSIKGQGRHSLDSELGSKGSPNKTRQTKDKAKSDGHGIADALKLVHSIPATVSLPEVVIERSVRSGNGSGSGSGSADVSMEEIGDISFVTAFTSLSPPRTPPRYKSGSNPNSPPALRSRNQSPKPPALRTPQHFITLPNSRPAFNIGTAENRKRWLRVEVGGVEDEVAAHCGLFIRGQNVEYDRFVKRVGKLVKSWVQ